MKNPLLLFSFLIILSCGKLTSHEYTFYYWQSNLTLNNKEKIVLNNSKVPYLYTRFFDIDKIKGKFQPISVLIKDASFKTDKKIVPVIFIKNEILYDIKPEEINYLAKSIFNLISRKSKELQLNLSDEIQIDCDWTAGTNEEYFDLLKVLKTISHKNVTCTLRPHHIQDRSLIGEPPVEKAYLLCFNSSPILTNSNKNSILDLHTLQISLDHLNKYPIKMDIVLPIFSRGIVTHQSGKQTLIDELSLDHLESNINFKEISKGNFAVLKDGFYSGNFLSKGFNVKIESVSQKELDQTLDFINTKLTFYNIIYYQLDSRFIKNYNL